jgi:sulfite reductase (NADPH) hemoprotein beta-component
MKILVHELGEDEFRRQVEEEFENFVSLGEDFPQAEYDRIAAYFAPPPFETGLSEEIDRSDPDFALWVDRQVARHKAPGYAIVNISLKPTGEIPGDISADQMDLVADLAERYSFDEAGIVDAVERAVDRYVEIREPGERFIDTYRRVGMDGFKEAIYG